LGVLSTLCGSSIITLMAANPTITIPELATHPKYKNTIISLLKFKL
jgi:hypothetical protein